MLKDGLDFWQGDLYLQIYTDRQTDGRQRDRKTNKQTGRKTDLRKCGQKDIRTD